jgi:YcaO-like protein with predicted kinase domain
MALQQHTSVDQVSAPDLVCVQTDPSNVDREGRVGPPPSEAFNLLLPLIRSMGITRLADLTGLDRIGLPVVQAVRPMSLSNAVSQGKGVDLCAAAVSAIFESAETFCAERIDSMSVVDASADALAAPEGWFESHLMSPAMSHWRQQVIPWVMGEDLDSHKTHPVPLELVHTAYVHPMLDHDGMFASSTSGLAAAFDGCDATLHGLLECVERDGLARASKVHGFFQHFRLDIGTAEDEALIYLIELVRRAGMIVGLWHIEGAGGIPVVWCHLMEAEQSQFPIMPHPAEGSAASLSIETAASKAIMEAAQSRLAAIAGAREDMTRAAYPKYPDWGHIAAHRKLLNEGPATLDFRKLQLDVLPRNGMWLPFMLSKLKAKGISSVLAVRLDTSPCHDIRVVKVLVPQLIPLREG